MLQAPDQRLINLIPLSTTTEGPFGSGCNMTHVSSEAFDPNAPSTTPADLPKGKRKQKKNHAQIIQLAFTVNSIYPSEYLRSCLVIICISRFLVDNDEEPTIGSENGDLILGGTPMLLAFCSHLLGQLGKSIYLAFIDSRSKQCLLCGDIKTTVPRTLNCVRSHLNHKPFHCSAVGCKFCKRGRYAFFILLKPIIFLILHSNQGLKVYLESIVGRPHQGGGEPTSMPSSGLVCHLY